MQKICTQEIKKKKTVQLSKYPRGLQPINKRVLQKSHQELYYSQKVDKLTIIIKHVELITAYGWYFPLTELRCSGPPPPPFGCITDAIAEVECNVFIVYSTIIVNYLPPKNVSKSLIILTDYPRKKKLCK